MQTSLVSKFRTFSSPQKETLYPLAVTPVSLSCHPLAKTNYFVSIDFPILGISYKENHGIWGLLCLASFF